MAASLEFFFKRKTVGFVILLLGSFTLTLLTSVSLAVRLQQKRLDSALALTGKSVEKAVADFDLLALHRDLAILEAAYPTAVICLKIVRSEITAIGDCEHGTWTSSAVFEPALLRFKYEIMVDTGFDWGFFSGILFLVFPLLVASFFLVRISIGMRHRILSDLNLLAKADTGKSEEFFFLEFKGVRLLQSDAALLRERSRELVATSQLAQQVAHDIRSPIASLNMLEPHLGALPEGIRIAARSAITRIQDIANTLSKKAKDTSASAVGVASSNDISPSVLGPSLVSAMLDSLVTEKRLEFRDRAGVKISFEVTPDSIGVFGRIDESALTRVLSNLINNGVEALSGTGQIAVKLDRTPGEGSNSFRIRITDSGKGMTPEVLAKIGERGYTLGKEGSASGSGLGIWHARETLKVLSGTLEFESIPGVGTTATILLPEMSPPKWFCPEIIVPPQTKVVVLDDDTNIHELWTARFGDTPASQSGVVLTHFTGPTDFSDYTFSDGSRVGHLYLMDYELVGHKVTGLKLIEGLGLSDCAVLVTSRYDQPEIQAKCEQLGVKLLPKGLAPYVPLRIQG
jgi:signal transduction histidine kinase